MAKKKIKEPVLAQSEPKYDVKKSLERLFVSLIIFGVTLQSLGYGWTPAIAGSICMGLWNAGKFYVKSKGYLWK